MTPEEFRELAARLAVEAGHIARDGRRLAGSDRSMGADTKSSLTDVVTEFDRAAEAHIVDALRSLRPDDAIIGEEGTDDDGTNGVSWFIDPIDGTTNFVYDIPAWSCSIGVAVDGAMVAGAVYVPALDELFTASLGGGATLNGTPISISGADDLSLSLVGTGFSYRPGTRREQARRILDLIGEVRAIRRLGSAAVDPCMVACGRLDAYYELHLNSWDAAAGELIAREAGALTSDFAGGPARPEEMLAATPAIHGALVQVLSRSITPD